jgi:Domain of unknown function (DUF4340)
MKFRGLLIAVTALAILGGLSYWSERNRAESEGKPAADAPPRLLTIPEDQITSVRVKTGPENTLLKKSGAGKWEIVEPKPLAADDASVSPLVSTLASLDSERLVEEKAVNLAQYGLGDPSLEITVIRKDGQTHKLLLGEETPVGSGVFAKLENDARVFTVPGHVRSSLNKTWHELRDRHLLRSDFEKLSRVEMQLPNETFEFGKNSQNEWQILKPKPLRSDAAQVDELVRKLKDAQMEAVVSPEDAKKAEAAFGSGAKVAVVSVADSAGVQQIEVRRDQEKNFYAKSTAVEGIHKIASPVGEAIEKNLDTYRNHKLFDFGWTEVSKLEIAKGGTTAAYQKAGEHWTSGGKQFDAATVQAVIDKLRDLGSTRFVETGGGVPLIEATVTSENGKRVEKVSVTKQGPSYYTWRGNDLTVYEIDPPSILELEAAIAAIKAAEPAPAAKK